MVLAMCNKSKHMLIIFVGAAALVMIILLVVLQRHQQLDRVLGLQNPPHLSDAELIATFYRHRAEFERLREMIVHDKQLFRIDSNRTLPDDLQSIHIPLSRIKNYRELFKMVGIRSIEVSSNRSYIEFTASFRGFATHNSQKGYVYTDKAPDTSQLFVELDQFTASGVGSGLRHIEGNWYLFFEGY